MSVIADLKEDLNTDRALKAMSTSLTEINSVKAKKIRDSFEKNARFYKEIRILYHSVMENAAKSRLLQILKKRQLLRPVLTQAFVAVTSNSRFFGPLNTQVVGKLLKDLNQADVHTDLVIIGQTGLDYLESLAKKTSYQSFNFRKDFPEPQESRVFLEKVHSYDKVVVYHPQFINMLNQKIGSLDIGQPLLLKEVPERKEMIRIEYIFEPELNKIVDFFETQVRALLFNRAMLEAELSRTAARLLSMNNASQRAGELIKETKNRLIKAVQSIKNARLLETFAGMASWQSEEN